VMETTSPHIPVMLKEVVSNLVSNTSGIYLDGTIGFAGHSHEILNQLTSAGQLIGLDSDKEALEFSQKRLSHFNNFTLFHSNFTNFDIVLENENISKIDGMLFDLGVSSYDIDTAKRGFSFRNNGPLDMRMDQSQGITAKEFIDSSDEIEIGKVIRDYGEERFYKKISRSIVKYSAEGKMETTADLANSISAVTGHHRKSITRVFQAIRIHINDELGALEGMLEKSTSHLVKGGRIAVITFHSLEDRIVKKFFQRQSIKCTCPREFPVCICNETPSLKILNKSVIKASSIEIKSNRRSKSAKLRIAERV